VSKLKAIIDSGRKAGIEAYHGSPYHFDESLQFDDPRESIRTPIFDGEGLSNQLMRPFPVPEL
jgi:hypothetical protein